jgi:protein O-GlcNAc transferase
MTSSSIQVALNHHQSGRLDVAEAAYRAILSTNPQEVNANHYLGMLLHSQGRSSEGITYVLKSVEAQSANWVFMNNLATIYIDLKKFREATETLELAAKLNRKSPELLSNLAKAQSLSGNHEAAIENYRRSLVLNPNSAKTLSGLSHAYLSAGRWKEAETSARKATSLDPNLSDAHTHLGTALLARGDFNSSLQSLERSLELAPNDLDALEAMSNTLMAMSRMREAESYLNEILDAEPERSTAQFSLGLVLMSLKRFSEALDIWKRRLAAPSNTVAEMANAALCLQSLARHDEAIEYYRQALAKPDCPPVTFSNFLYSTLFSEHMSAEEIWQEHRNYGEKLEGGALARTRGHENTADPNRKLRVGFVSGDLRMHPVSFYIEPILQHFNRSDFELFAYYNHTLEDAVSNRLQELFDQWLPCMFLSDDELDARIREDKIDILFDLSGHTSHNRLLVFARKPAPVQITWLGYPGTTGLASMDYKITDALMDPVGLADKHHSETLIRLPGRNAAFTPIANAPAVGDPPCLRNGFVIFGCLNNPAKIGPRATKVWSAILQQLPGSKLILSTGTDQARIKYVTDLFSSFGVGIDRLVLEPWRYEREYLELHHEIDIALDPFPYNGGTSTNHALFMGVPVIALAGDHTVSRVGVAILSSLGLDEFVALTEADYVERATKLSQNVPRLKELRMQLRSKLTLDPNADSILITRELERAIRTAWATWCASSADAKTI